MKSPLQSFLFFAAICIITASCTKSNSNTATSIFLTAKINGTTWNANMVSAYTQTSSPIETVITGVDTSTNKSITLYLFNYNNTTGTFNTDATSARAAWKNSYNITSSPGQVVITSVSGGYISGTFSFTAGDSTQVSAGSFTAQLP